MSIETSIPTSVKSYKSKNFIVSPSNHASKSQPSIAKSIDRSNFLSSNSSVHKDQLKNSHISMISQTDQIKAVIFSFCFKEKQIFLHENFLFLINLNFD